MRAHADRAAADLRCDGVADQREINDAFNLLPDDTGTVRLTAGTFNCSESVFPNGGCGLIGAGQGATRLVVVNDQSPWKPISVTQPDVHLRGFTIMGSGGVLVKVSRVVVEEVTATSRGPDGSSTRPAGTGCSTSGPTARRLRTSRSSTARPRTRTPTGST